MQTHRSYPEVKALLAKAGIIELGPRYPDVEVALEGVGDAFHIMALVTQAMERAGVAEAEIEAFIDEGWRLDFIHLLDTAERWVQVL